MTEYPGISEALETEYLLEKIEGETPTGWRTVCECANNGCPFAKNKQVFYRGCAEGLCTIEVVPINKKLVKKVVN